MINIIEKKNCCGCTACASICPKNCIKMIADKEGFLYPVVDMDKCIDCGLCNKVCRIENPVREEIFEQKAYLFQHKNKKIRYQSTSGGAFTAIAEIIIAKGGVVFGAGFDENFVVKHQYAGTFQELKKFRNSKYVQSDMNSCYNQAKKFLDDKKIVLFSGTPCQIEGLLSYLRKPYKNLITVDVVCRAVPSPLVWEKYKEIISQGRKIMDSKFRDKSPYGYEYSQMSMKFDSEKINCGVESDYYLRAFFSDMSDRPSCYDCRFKKRYRLSDITIWDCFDVYKFDKSFDDNSGVTRMLVHFETGRKIADILMKYHHCIEIDADRAVDSVNEMFNSVKINPKRENFFRELNSNPDSQAVFDKYFPLTLRVKTEKFVRNFSKKLGIYKYVKKAAKKILGK